MKKITENLLQEANTRAVAEPRKRSLSFSLCFLSATSLEELQGKTALFHKKDSKAKQVLEVKVNKIAFVSTHNSHYPCSF
uniref:Uncharacterized protein n=1 Tax=Rhizophora mucronata TaxID=61149 RepID=A0A2P2R2M8_RHIMU